MGTARDWFHQSASSPLTPQSGMDGGKAVLEAVTESLIFNGAYLVVASLIYAWPCFSDFTGRKCLLGSRPGDKKNLNSQLALLQ